MLNRTTQARIPELDGLRGAAILSVLLYHYIGSSPGAGLGTPLAYFQRLFSMMWFGVDLFFVLSGFLIGGILLDVRESPRYFKTFYLRRFFRIIPLYYGWILCYVAIMAIAGPRILTSLHAIPESRFPMYTYFLFLYSLKPVQYSLFAAAWFVPLWSLSVEEQFYLISPLLIRFFSTLVLSVALVLVIVGAPFLRVWVRSHVASGFQAAYSIMPCRADALAVGMLIAVLWRRPDFRSYIGSHSGMLDGLFAVLCVGALVLWFRSPSAYTFPTQAFGYTWLALLFGSTLLLILVEREGLVASLFRMAWLRDIGGISYCAYIIHQAVNFVFHSLLLHAEPSIATWSGALVTVLAALATYGLAKASWKFFEQPLQLRGHAYKY